MSFDGSVHHCAFTNWSSLPDSRIIAVVEAIRQELPLFCRAWNIEQPGVQFYSRDVELPVRESLLVSAVDDDGNPDSLGFHTVLAGTPLFVWEAAKGDWIASHEFWEILGNPLLDRWATAPDGRRWWLELSDGTQGDVFDVDVEVFGERSTVPVANWLAPSFFGMANGGGFTGHDRMGVCEPFTLRPGGYSETISADGRRERIGAARADKGRTTSRTGMLTDALAGKMMSR